MIVCSRWAPAAKTLQGSGSRCGMVWYGMVGLRPLIAVSLPVPARCFPPRPNIRFPSPSQQPASDQERTLGKPATSKQTTLPHAVYSPATNTLRVSVGGYGFSGGRIAYMSRGGVDVFFEALRLQLDEIGRKVHAEISYEGAEIGEGVQEYWKQQVKKLEEDCYLSVQRVGFGSAFGLL